MKRSRGDTLTGGTRDVNPQVLNVSLQQFAALTEATVVIPVPIARIGPKQDKVVVMELTKIVWMLNTPTFATTTAAVRVVQAVLSTAVIPPGQLASFRAAMTNPAVIDGIQSGIVTAQPNAFGNALWDLIEVDPVYHDLTDGAGHGILVAVDQMHLTMFVQSPGDPTLYSTGVKIYYRFKEVSLVEYIGIVQQQSVSNA